MARKNIQANGMQPHAQVRPSVWARRVKMGRVVLTLSVDRQHEEEERAVMTNRLAALRQERGLAREELAEQLQLHPSTMIELEKGRYEPSLRLALRISEFFEVPVETLFSMSPTGRVVAAELVETENAEADHPDEEESHART